ncbi:hypothetical protein B0H11DRAFT_83298 [Mycena galericulata]|nr:hypothetical protein B0H11DRAFT_83298 [Mycena galericulata]
MYAAESVAIRMIPMAAAFVKFLFGVLYYPEGQIDLVGNFQVPALHKPRLVWVYNVRYDFRDLKALHRRLACVDQLLGSGFAILPLVSLIFFRFLVSPTYVHPSFFLRCPRPVETMGANHACPCNSA